MALPLFNTEYLLGPGAAGAITPQTAQLLAQQGQELGKRIEKKAAQAIAAAKAPAMAQGYADAYTRIGQGDMSGFGILEQIGASAVGNPFLSQMHKDATQAATQIANNSMQARLQDERLRGQIQLQGVIQQGQLNRDDRILDRQSESQRSMSDREAYRKASEEQQKLRMAHGKSIEAYKARVEQGDTEARPPDPLVLPDLPEPVSETFQATPRGDPAAASLTPPLPSDRSSVLPETSLVNETTREVGDRPRRGANPQMMPTQGSPLMVGPEPLPSTGVPSMAKAVPFSEERALAEQNVQPIDESKANIQTRLALNDARTIDGQFRARQKKEQEPQKPKTTERNFGSFIIETEVPPEKGPDRVTSINDGVKTDKYSRKAETPKLKEFLDAIGTVETTNPSFSRWATSNAGKDITFKPVMDAKGKPVKELMQPYAIDPKTGKEEAYSTPKEIAKEVDGQQVKETQFALNQIDKKVADAYSKSVDLLRGDLKGKVVTYKRFDPKGQPVTEEFREVARERTAIQVAYGKMDLKQANEQLRSYKIKPLTKAEVEEISGETEAIAVRKGGEDANKRVVAAAPDPRAPTNDRYMNPLPSPDELVRNLTTF